MTPIPYSAEDLIKQLDEIYPERCPTPDMTDREIWMVAGQRKLVTNLKARLAAQQTSEDLPNVLRP